MGVRHIAEYFSRNNNIYRRDIRQPITCGPMHIESPLAPSSMLDCGPQTPQIRVNQFNLTTLIQTPLREAADAPTKVHDPTARANVLGPMIHIERPFKQLVFMPRVAFLEKIHPTWMLKPPFPGPRQVLELGLRRTLPIMNRHQFWVSGIQ
jgi:hypothetical protein